jgi:RND family efflux transporter MFP subunit
MGKQMGIGTQVLVSGLIAAAAAGLWFAPADVRDRLPFLSPEKVQSGEVKGGGAKRRSREHPVIVAPVEKAKDDVTIEVVGTGRAARSVILRSEASGRIVELAIVPNTTYKRGDVLLELESEEEQLALKLAQTRLSEAERVRGRARDLRQRGVVAEASMTEVETDAEIARLEVDRARQTLTERTLRAPFDGVAGISNVEEGAWVDSNRDIASFDDRSTILVEFDLPQAALARLNTGMEVEALTPVYPGRIFTGNVTAVDSRIDVSSRTARVRVSIPNEKDELRPGASFTIRMTLPGPEYYVVPELALLFAREGLHVWSVADGKARKVPVTQVRRREGRVLVDGELNIQDVVVVEGTQRLREGNPVNVIGTRGEGAS